MEEAKSFIVNSLTSRKPEEGIVQKATSPDVKVFQFCDQLCEAILDMPVHEVGSAKAPKGPSATHRLTTCG